MMKPGFGSQKYLVPGGATPTPVGITDGWELIKEVDVLVATTQVDLTGLDGDVDELYRLLVQILKVVASVGTIKLRLNNDSGANYDEQLIEVSGLTHPGGRSSGVTEMRLGGSTGIVTTINTDVILAVKSGAFRVAVAEYGGTEGPGISLDVQANDWTNTVDNITEMNIFTGVANDIGVGSRVLLFRKVSN